MLEIKEQDLEKPFISIGSNHFEVNPCNNHLGKLSKIVKENLGDNLVGMKYDIPGVSDGITNGLKGGLFSLPSRELIADSYESMNISHYFDGNIFTY